MILRVSALILAAFLGLGNSDCGSPLLDDDFIREHSWAVQNSLEVEHERLYIVIGDSFNFRSELILSQAVGRCEVVRAAFPGTDFNHWVGRDLRWIGRIANPNTVILASIGANDELRGDPPSQVRAEMGAFMWKLRVVDGVPLEVPVVFLSYDLEQVEHDNWTIVDTDLNYFMLNLDDLDTETIDGVHLRLSDYQARAHAIVERVPSVESCHRDI